MFEKMIGEIDTVETEKLEEKHDDSTDRSDNNPASRGITKQLKMSC